MTRSAKILIALLATVFVFAFGLTAGVLIGGARPSGAGSSDFRALEDAWRVITQEYVDKQNVDTYALSQAAIQAMMDLIDDPYSTYLDRDSYEMSLAELEGKYEGIGAEISMEEGRPIIVATYNDSPAEQAGLVPGDAILAVNGETTTDLGLMDIVLLVRGPKGSEVVLTVASEDGQTSDVSITREEVYAQSVSYEMVEGYGHIRISQFGENTNNELGDALSEILDQGAKGIILDLRYNPGGLVDSVVDVASRFITEGVIFSANYSSGQEEIYNANNQSLTTDLPMVVLVNGFSASGSEVISGALQDYNRAIVAGTTTFGKGSVNVLTQIGDDQGIYISVGRWYTPNGHMIEGNGIEPDEELTLQGDALVSWAVDYLNGLG